MSIVKIVNAEGGSDARYDVNQMTPEERVNFDGEGRPLGVGFPDQDVWTQGLPGARGGDSPYSMGGSSVGSSTPMDAYTRQLQSLLESQSQAERAGTIEQMRQALIAYGVVPQGFQDEMGALDDTTRQLIEKNTQTGISGYARMKEAKDDAMRQMLAQLSGKGLRRSGAKGFLGRRAQLNWDRQSADATAALLSNLGGLKKTFAQGEAARKQQLMQAMFNQSPSSAYNAFQASQPKQEPNWYQVSTPTATVPQALQSYQTAWDTHKDDPGFANYWAQNTSPVAPSSPFWGRVKVTG
jgi:hypothetical protein